MSLHLLFGVVDASARSKRQAELCDEGDVESLSCDDGGSAIAVAIATPSFFGSRTLVARDAELISKAGVKSLVAALRESTATVVLLSDKTKAPAALKDLVAIGSAEYFNTPANVGALVRSLARDAGLELGDAVLARLTSAADSDLELVRSVLEQMKATPGDVNLDALLEGVGTTSTPWEIARCIERGQVAELYALTEGADLVGTCAYLAGWAVQLGAAAEMTTAGGATAPALASALALTNERSAGNLLESYRSLGPVVTDVIVRGLAGVDVMAKLHGSRSARVVLVDLARQVRASRLRLRSAR